MTLSREHLLQWLAHSAQAFKTHQDELTDLDREIGDGDHGLNMQRGFAKVAEKLPELSGKPPADILKTTGMTLLSSVGGASGPLYGTFFIKAAQSVGNSEHLDLPALAAAVQAGTDGIIARGHAQEGDKTLCDVWLPVCAHLQHSRAPLAQAVQEAAAIAAQAADATIPMQAKKGRASYLQERSIGHKDPGAASSALLLAALAQTLAGEA